MLSSGEFFLTVPTNKMWSYATQIAGAMHLPLPRKTFKATHAFILSYSGVYRHRQYKSRRKKH